MKSVLINPPPMQVAERHDAPDHPHCGLGYIASYLLSRGEDTEIIDSKLERLGLQQTLDKLLSMKPDIVGITAMTHDILSAAKLAQLIKNEKPDLAVVIGGVHATALPKDTLESFQSFDILVYGEGEHAFYELVKQLESKKPISEIQGIAYREEDKIVVTSRRPWIDDLDSLPIPAWQLFPKTEKYHIVTARGCPFSCIFCMSPYGRKIRVRSPENVIAEMNDVVRKYHPRIYKFDDESFAFDKARAHRILDLVIENKLDGIKKIASMRADYVDLELLVHMKKAGFEVVDFGFETGSPEIMKIIKKGITLDQARNAVSLCRKAGIKVGGNFIIGHPHETSKTIRETIKFAVELNPDIVAFGIMVPYPGTEVAEIAKRGEGGYKVISSNWADYNKQLGNALELNEIGRKQLEAYQLKAYVSIYLLNLRFMDFAGFCWENRKAASAFARHFFSRR